jgi:hypothetical protein
VVDKEIAEVCQEIAEDRGATEAREAVDGKEVAARPTEIIQRFV